MKSSASSVKATPKKLYYFKIMEEEGSAPSYGSSSDEEPLGLGDSDEHSSHMAAAVDSSSLKEFLICLGCKNHLINPITLPCLHNFCMECLKTSHEAQWQREKEAVARRREEEEAMISTEQDSGEYQEDFSITGLQAEYRSIPCSNAYKEEDVRVVGNGDNIFFCCPLKDCDGVTDIPLGNPARLLQLEINEPLINIQHTLSMKRDLPRGRVDCRSCGTSAAIGVCCNKDCNNHPYCGNCLEFHLRDNKRHVIVYPDGSHHASSQEEPAESHSLYTAESPLDASSTAMPEVHSITIDSHTSIAAIKFKMNWNDLKQCDILCRCDGHERFFRNLYCEEHGKVICLACTGSGGAHRRCEDITSAADRYEECFAATERKLKEMEKMNDYFRASIKTTEEVKRALRVKVDTVKESVQERYTSLENELRAQKEDLLRKCDEIYRQKNEELEQHLVVLNQVTRKLEHCINFTTRFKQSAIASEFMMLRAQIDGRLNELTNKYSKYRCETNEDDCIFLEENKNFTFTGNAIGEVFSTPSVKNFSLTSVTGLPTPGQAFYLLVTIRDSVGNKLLCHTSMPRLQATIRHVDEDEAINGYIEKDNKGRYNVLVYPARRGLHELCIFQQLNPPYGKYFVGGKKYMINI